MARARGRFLKFLQIGAIAGPTGKRDILALECTGLKHGIGKSAGRQPFPIFQLKVGKVVSEHDRPVLQFFREHTIVFEARSNVLQDRLKQGVAFQLRPAQLLQNLQSGALVRLGEKDVEPDYPYFVMVE